MSTRNGFFHRVISISEQCCWCNSIYFQSLKVHRGESREISKTNCYLFCYAQVSLHFIFALYKGILFVTIISSWGLKSRILFCLQNLCGVNFALVGYFSTTLFYALVRVPFFSKQGLKATHINVPLLYSIGYCSKLFVLWGWFFYFIKGCNIQWHKFILAQKKWVLISQ